jgi:hypothetical protein
MTLGDIPYVEVYRDLEFLSESQIFFTYSGAIDVQNSYVATGPLRTRHCGPAMTPRPQQIQHIK